LPLPLKIEWTKVWEKHEAIIRSLALDKFLLGFRQIAARSKILIKWCISWPMRKAYMRDTWVN